MLLNTYGTHTHDNLIYTARRTSNELVRLSCLQVVHEASKSPSTTAPGHRKPTMAYMKLSMRRQLNDVFVRQPWSNGASV